MKLKIESPICVFDAGIGSYDIANKVYMSFPDRDIIYLGDRANFPYGKKSKKQLKKCIEEAIDFFLQFDPELIILASNAPSIMILDEIKSNYNIPIIGVFPPIDDALKQSKNAEIGVLGVDALIQSNEMQQFITKWSDREAKIHLIPASDLVKYVENGAFLLEEKVTSDAVKQKMDLLPKNIDVYTLSSTHLPWLKKYFESLFPNKKFIDPADTVIQQVTKYLNTKTNVQRKGHLGRMHILTTESSEYKAKEFIDMLNKLGVHEPVFLKEDFYPINKPLQKIEKED